ncbi:MAG: hypothetical protein GSR79_03865 [Desulfurococcales archaeon]|nr:hypothetical protein [Desulfurococcales archaeon]
MSDHKLVKRVLFTVFTMLIILSLMISTIRVDYAQEINYRYYINHVNPEWMPSESVFYKWNVLKDMLGPTYSGSPAWHKYMSFLEKELRSYGVINITKNSWTYKRWYTTDWPNDTGWSLSIEGKPIRVASYYAYSGSTNESGITAPLIFYNMTNPPKSIQGKIVVFTIAPYPKPPYSPLFLALFTFNDYEYLSNPETFPPIHTLVPPSVTVSFDVWYQLNQLPKFAKILTEGHAAGGLIVMNMSYDRAAGLYTFPVPSKVFGVPTLLLDRDAGKEVIQAALEGKNATLKLLAKEEVVETFQLIGYLPGKYYGTPKDEQILLITHTDGPSISQENGALGLLGIVAYFSHIPQDQRPRTLMIFLDSRHYMPGKEQQWASVDWFTKHPEAKKHIVGLIAMEHLGQVEYREVGDTYEPTGLVEPSFLWTQNNQKLIDLAIKAVKDNHWPRVQVQCVDRPGIHGESQGIWYGMGKIARTWHIPAFAMMGTQGAYWATSAKIDKFDKHLFYIEVATMTQLTGELMLSNLSEIWPVTTSSTFSPRPTTTTSSTLTTTTIASSSSTPQPQFTTTSTESQPSKTSTLTLGIGVTVIILIVLVGFYIARQHT